MKRVRSLLIPLLLLALVLAVGCGSSGKDNMAVGGDGEGGYEDVVEDSEPNGGQESPVIGDEKTYPGGTGPADRKYIYRGEIFLHVEDIGESENKIREQVEAQGGFIEASRYNSDPKGETHTTYLTVRVPYSAFYNTMEFLETLGKMVNRRTGSSDVTLQYVDTEARIRVLTKQEERFTEILAKAKTVAEILEIERELVKVRSEIESLTSQFNHLKDRVDYATIDISLQQTVLATPGVTAQGFKGAWSRAIQGLTENINRIINGLAGLFVFSLSSLPFLLLLVAAVYIFIKFFRKGRKKDGKEV